MPAIDPAGHTLIQLARLAAGFLTVQPQRFEGLCEPCGSIATTLLYRADESGCACFVCQGCGIERQAMVDVPGSEP